ncbi:MAG: TM2 domain-containing protein [Novosphingobium sp.]
MDEGVRQQLTFEANRKSTGAAYLLLIFLGGFGAHRFYLGQTGTAIAQLLLGLLGWIPLFAGWIVLGIWLFVDLFLIPGIIREKNMELVSMLGSGNVSAAQPSAETPTQ